MLSSISSFIINRGRVTVGRRFSYPKQSSVTMKLFHSMGAAAAATAMLALATTTTTTTIGVHSFATTSSRASGALFPRHTSSTFSSQKTSSVLVRGGSTAAAAENTKAPSLVQRSMTATSDALSTASSSTTATTMDSMTPAAKLEALRNKMKELNLDVYIIPSDDPHLSGE
jgi:hypothetical protein